uniref:Uncharacterized protein n=1 Tax=Arundo donax TaxID=35708 RepID=A0A0A8Z3L4_ARUDO
MMMGWRTASTRTPSNDIADPMGMGFGGRQQG